MRHKLLSSFVLWIVALGGGHVETASARQAATAPAQAAAPATPTAPPVTHEPPTSAPAVAAPAPVKFNFKGATFQQVIEFFSRATGLPVIWESPAPDGTLDYVSPQAYDLPEALHVLNIILQAKGVMLRVDNQKLFLQKLTEMQKEDIPTYIGKVPAEVTGDQIITVVRPLKIALSKPLAEKLATMVASYGAVTAMEQQNALVITETAAQANRILTIIEQLDKDDPEGAVQVFHIANAKAKDLMGPLTALLATKVEKYVVNEKGQQIKIEENQMPGLSISPDERTNSIIAKGVQNKLDKLGETIKLLDVPSAGEGRLINTIILSRISAVDAAAKLQQLFQKTPEKQRPTILTLDELSKVVIIGDEDDVRDATLLINTLEGGTVAAKDLDPVIAVIVLERARPAPVIAAINSLLNKRQQAVTKLLAGADDKSLIVAGQAADVEAVKQLVPVLDRQSAPDRQVRLMRITAGDAKSTLEQARKVYDAQKPPGDAQMDISAELDGDSRLVTLIGSAKAVEAFTSAVKMIEANIVIDREARRFELANLLPSEVIAPLTSLATPLLQPTDGSAFVPPVFTAVDALNTLVVTATPEQYATLQSIIASLDVPANGGAGRPPMRIVRLRVADAANLASIISNQYSQRSPAERKAKPVSVAADGSTNSLILAVHQDVLTEIQAMIAELDKTERLDIEGREIRIFPLKVARAEELAKTIDEMYPPPPAPVDARGRPQPQLQKPREIVVRADVQTNSLIVDAPVQRMNGFEQLVEQLDRQQIITETQVRTYQVRHADLNALSNTLRQLAASGTLNPAGQDRRVAVTISTEPVSQTVIVSGPADIFARVDQVMKELDVKRSGPATTLRFFKLNHAKADAVAGMLREVLTTRISQDVPEAGALGASVQALLNVTADRKTNTLIISAPEAVMPAAEQIIKQLDEGTASIGDPVVRVKPLTFADAAGVSASLSTALASTISKATGDPVSVKLIPAPGSNAIILVGLEADLAEVETLIEPLDARPATDSMDAKTFALQHADAGVIGPVVQRLLTDQQETDPRIILERIRRSRGQIDNTPRIRVEADTRTNSLIVSGTMQTVSLAETLIKQLDLPDENTNRTFATYTPVNADPAALAQSAKKVLDATRATGRPSTIDLLAEPQSGAIVVIGSAEETKRAIDLLKQRDGESLTAPQMDFRVVRLKNAPADIVAKALSALLTDRSRWPAKLLAVARANLSVGQPVAVADPSNNRIMVSAPTDLMPLANQLIAELDQSRTDGEAVQVRVFNLSQASAADIAAALKTALDARAAAQPGQVKAVIAAEPSSNSVIVTASAAQMTDIENLIKPLDAFGGGADQSQVRTVFLKHARAENVAPVVEKLLNAEQIPVAIRYDAIRNNRPLPPSGPQVRVAPETRLNAVMIAAPNPILNVAEQMVSQLDIDPNSLAGSETRSVRVLTIDNADAAQLSTSLDAIFSAPDQLDSKPVIRVDAASNSLLVRATDAQFKTIEQVVAQVDKATIASSRQMRMIPIDPAKGDAAEIARALQQMIDRAGTGSKVQVITLDELLKRREKQSANDKSPPPPAKATSALPARFATLVFAMMADGAPAATQPDAAAGPGVTIAIDPATNSLILLGSPRAIERITGLVKQLQEQLPSAPGTVHSISMPDGMDATALASTISQVIEKLAPAAGQPGDLKKRVAVIADAGANTLIIACNDADFETVADLIAALSKPASNDVPVRTITLKHAEAAAVARGIQQFYDDRAKMTAAGRGGGQRERPRKISIMGIESTNTLLISASDAEFAQVQQLVEQFDTAEASEALTFRVFQLKNAKAIEIERTVQRLVDDLTYNQGDQNFFFWPPINQNAGKKKDTVAVRADARLNTLIVTGRGDKFDVVEKMIEILDAAPLDGEQRIVKVYRVKHADLQTVADVVQEVFNQGRQPRRSWEPPDPTQIKVRTDDAANVLIVSATGKEQDDIAKMITGLDAEVAATGSGVQDMQVLPVKFARAAELAITLTRFLADRAKAVNAPRPSATIVASDTVNTLIVAASPDDMAMLRDLLSRLDQPDVTGDRVVEILALQQGKAEEIARIIKEQFGRRAAAGNASALIVTADARTNSIIVNAPQQEFAQAKALIERLDAPSDSDETVIRTYALNDAFADQAVRVLTQTLQLDSRGQTPGKGITIKLDDPGAQPVEVKARIVADKRSNNLIVTATEASFPIIEAIINKLDNIPAKNPQEWRIITLKFAMASDVANTLTQITRSMDDGAGPPKIDINRLENKLIVAATADQFKQITTILAQIDLPSEQERITDFVPLQFAQAAKIQEALSVFYGQNAAEADTPGKKNVRIVADPATNSLVISAEKEEWDGVRALITRLDSEQYDSSLQLKVLPLVYADAQSVARAINDAFQTTVQRSNNRGGGGGANRPQGFPFDFFGGGGSSTTLVQADEWVRASAEPQTNAVIVSASRQNLTKVEQILKQLDIADYAKLPPPRIIPISAGDPMQFAQSLTQLYLESRPQGGGGGSGFPPLHIVGNAASNSIIVRAEDTDYQQIKTLAEALQQQASSNGLTVNVLKLQSAPAARVAQSITEAYQAKAKQANQPLSIRVDPTGNSLVIASTGPLFNEIKSSVAQLDAIAPAAGQGIFIIELQNTSPDAARNVIQTIGLDKPQPADSTSRLVTEPVKVSLLAGRNAIIIVGNPADKETIIGLMKAIDSEPPLADSQTHLVRLKHAQAAALNRILGEILKPADQQADTPLATALREQVRRLSVRSDVTGLPAVQLDLTKPIRLIPDPGLNAIVVSSTEKNVAAIEQMIAMFDQLPITDKVTVQIFPLQNIAAEQFARIVKDLFTQGKQVGKTALTKVAGIPDGAVGKALLDDLLISTDERTNTVIVGGTEEVIALVEVLSKRIDSDVAAGWVEPKVLPLRFADAGDLAATLQAIIVEGTGNLPQSSPLQRQVGRLRMARLNKNAAGQTQPPAATGGPLVLEADVFVPMTRLVIRPEPQMNALILVGTPDNIEVVTELVSMLDIEAASPANAVRIYPVDNASAARLAQTVRTLFDQQVQSKAIRPEDRVIVQADERTNALVVATSPRSFAVLESLLKTLDSKMAPELREIRTIDVKNASATRLATLIQQMMDARLERMRKVQPETADLERATVISDPRTNSLVVAAGNDTWEVIKRLASDLDVNTLGEASMIQVLPVQQGNADRLAQTITKIMDRRYADLPAELRNSQRPLVQTDPRSNSLLVAANPEDMAAIQDLVIKIGAVPENPAVGVNLITLAATTRAELIAPRLQRLMQERMQTLGTSGTPSDRVSIEPDPGSNSLIVAASDENFQVIKGLVDVLVQAEAAGHGKEVEIVTLTSSRAPDIVDMLNDLYVQEANRSRGAGSVKVTADERINAVLINAPESDVRAIKGLIAQLDGAKPAGVVEIKYVPLQSANALETVSLIENVLSGRGIGARRGTRQATVLKYLREIAKVPAVQGDVSSTQPATQPADDLAPVEMQVSAAIRESITLTPDLRTNTIIVSAPRESITMIERMIRDLDDSNTGSKSIRIFKLVNADAVAMQEILTELFRLKQGSNLYVLKPREDGQPALGNAPATIGSPVGDAGAPVANSSTSISDAGGGGAGSISGTELTAVPDERQQLSITVDSRTNSLIVSGTPTYLDLVAKVVDDLDKLEANEREVYVYQLRNAEALEVAKVLSTFVDQEQKKLVGTLSADQLGSAARLLEREITIQGDEKSNTVLVSASPRYMDRVKDMIKKLDVDPPQVLIQVMLAEVTLDSRDTWGVDMRVGGHVGGADITGAYGLASAFVTGMGVPNLAITSSDFDLLIRAMQSQGRLQVLSNPSIMAANNAPARIQIGQTVQVPSSTSVSDAGQTSTTLEKQELGVILKVTPSINPDGFVRMTINPEISDLSERTTQVSSDFQAPIINRRTADTVVTVHDGQTVVIGGLISDRFERRDNKVPVLGDIPFFGALFRSSTDTTAKTELLIVLTPHVIESPTEFDRVGEITDAEIDRLSLPQDVKDNIRKGLLEGTGALYDAKGNRIDLKDGKGKDLSNTGGVPWK